jgi:plastocyanin
MKKSLIIGIIAAIVIVLIIIGYNIYKPAYIPPSQQSQTESAASANTAPQEGVIEASMENFAFVPAEIKIKAGTIVIWTNNDNSPHTVSSDSGGKAELNSITLSQGNKYNHTFARVGTFNYHCNYHNTMKGKVVVEESP